MIQLTTSFATPTSAAALKRLAEAAPAPEAAAAAEERDLVVVQKAEAHGGDSRMAVGRKALGAIGAAAGATVGRIAVPIATAYGAGVAANLGLAAAFPALPSPIGIGLVGLAGIIGLVAGAALEMKARPGKLLGGLAGGVAGSVVGSMAGVVGWRPSESIANLTRNFSVVSLPKKMYSPNYTAYRSLRRNPEARQAIEKALPGDLILAHHENYFEGAQFLTRMAGARAGYTHMGLVTEAGTVIDMVSTGPQERNANAWLKFTHLAVLRPQYKDFDSMMATIEGARAALKTVQYDGDFKLDNEPDKEYCGEFMYKRFREHAPDIELQPQSRFGFKFVTPDIFEDSPQMQKVYDSGASFWMSYLSRYS